MGERKRGKERGRGGDREDIERKEKTEAMRYGVGGERERREMLASR